MTKFFDWLRSPRGRSAEPFPDQWRSLLSAQYAHYRRLPSELQTAFERGVQRFIAKQRITGVEMEVDSDLRLLVAASAATLSLGWQGYKWKEVGEVLLYPDYFDHDFTIGPREVAGHADLWGTVILSVPALWHSFQYSDDGYHVGLHEFAHLLAYEQARNVGIPRGLRTTEIQQWLTIQERELKKLRRGPSVVNTMGRDWAEEFFPSTVEAFFERPIPLKQMHRRLYAFLCNYFGQDPAMWELEHSSAMKRDRNGPLPVTPRRNRARE